MFNQAVFYNKYHARYCPCCIKENYYYRNLWDVSFVTVCMNHKTFLVENCDGCGQKISMQLFMKGKCNCGNYYVSANAKKVNSQRIYEVQKLIQKLLLNKQEQILVSDSIILTPREYFDFFQLFGLIIDNIKLNDPYFVEDGHQNRVLNYARKNKELRDIEMINQIVLAIHDLITNPQKILLELFLVLNKSVKENSEQSFYKKNQKLKMIFKHKKGKIHKQLYLDYIGEFNEFRYHEKLRMSHYSVSVASDVIGLGQNVINNLIGKDLLQSIKVTRKGMTSLVQYIEKRLVHQFLDDITKRCQLIETIEDENLIKFNRVISYMSQFGKDIPDLITMIKEGDFKNIYLSKNNRNFKGIYLKKVELNILIMKLKIEKIKDEYSELKLG